MPKAAAGMQAVGQLIGGLSAKGQADAAAQQLRNQAVQEQQIGEVRLTDFTRDASAARASSVAASGASGIAQEDFEDARANFDQEVELQGLRIRANTLTRINALSTEADNAKKQGTLALIQGGLNAGSSFLSGGRGSIARTNRLIANPPPVNRPTNTLSFNSDVGGRFFPNTRIGK